MTEKQRQAFERGFVEKCAEYGVDPNELVKYAQDTSLMRNFGRELRNDISERLNKGTIARGARALGRMSVPSRGRAQPVHIPRRHNFTPGEILRRMPAEAYSWPESTWTSATNNAARLMDLENRDLTNTAHGMRVKGLFRDAGLDTAAIPNVSHGADDFHRSTGGFKGLPGQSFGLAVIPNRHDWYTHHYTPGSLTNLSSRAMTQKLQAARRISDAYGATLRRMGDRVEARQGN